jgi:hypothetical protein
MAPDISTVPAPQLGRRPSDFENTPTGILPIDNSDDNEDNGTSMATIAATCMSATAATTTQGEAYTGCSVYPAEQSYSRGVGQNIRVALITESFRFGLDT